MGERWRTKPHTYTGVKAFLLKWLCPSLILTRYFLINKCCLTIQRLMQCINAVYCEKGLCCVACQNNVGCSSAFSQRFKVCGTTQFFQHCCFQEPLICTVLCSRVMSLMNTKAHSSTYMTKEHKTEAGYLLAFNGNCSIYYECMLTPKWDSWTSHSKTVGVNVQL